MNQTSIRIGALNVSSTLVAAPLAGYSDLAFRLLCREYGAGLVFSEMLSCHGLVRRQLSTMELTRTLPAERPVIMQLFGAEPEVMGEAAAILARLPIDGIDINMGCPAKKVVKKGAGAALMREPQLAAAIIQAVVKGAAGEGGSGPSGPSQFAPPELAEKLPVTVKFRAGWNHQSINAPEFARICQDCGAAAVTIHGRTFSDGFSGRADQEVIAAVKAAVEIPVIGNGDVTSHQQARLMRQNTGCDAVMIGRGAVGAPWVFNPQLPTSPPMLVRLQAALRHLELIRLHHPEHHPARINNQLGRYFKGVTGGSVLRKEIYQCANPQQLHELLQTQVATIQQCPIPLVATWGTAE